MTRQRDPTVLVLGATGVLARDKLLVDLSAGPAQPGRALAGQVHDPRGTVILHAGMAPGVTNLVAAELLARGVCRGGPRLAQRGG